MNTKQRQSLIRFLANAGRCLVRVWGFSQSEARRLEDEVTRTLREGLSKPVESGKP